ncbi:MAG: metal-dependent transcriptional regulator [Bulleidia sp.]|nr:metal-dependent transcriptional regulator [Erysipelotrichaceae bacterium]MDD6663225.1 metal-dependent transcriptional regulator [Bulleidia sp.]MDY4809251.1 metal-dependent transcriptional regulator [Bulleidia sp.]
MKHNRSSEDYLETILILSERLPVVRSIDIAIELNFSKPSVSVAMKHLKESGKINVSTAGYITLTDTGKEIAEKVYERHRVLAQMLVTLGVNEKTANEDACEMEHVISEETFRAIQNHINAVKA